MTELVKNALEEYKTLKGERQHNAFSRKMFTAMARNIITKEEFHAIRDAIDEYRHEEMHKDMERIDKAIKMAIYESYRKNELI